MIIGLAQINSHLGDFQRNSQLILETVLRAKEKRVELVVFPELALFGYYPGDLLERKSIVDAQLKELQKIEKKIPDSIGVLIGAITINTGKGKPFRNSAIFMEKGKKPKVFNKTLLPTYDVFDESRHIEPGNIKNNILKFKKKRILITICEDIWGWPPQEGQTYSSYATNPIKEMHSADVDLVVNLSASPFTLEKRELRGSVVERTAKHLKAPMIYVNMAGAQDELIFDGGSFAIDKNGKLLTQATYFEEDLALVDFDRNEGFVKQRSKNELEKLREAIVLGIRDFIGKTGLGKVHLGLSGGIDSALVACLAVDALGSANVIGVGMPGPYNDPRSLKSARELAKNLEIEFITIPIERGFNSVVQEFSQATGKAEEVGVVQENFQARIRCAYLMAVSNSYGSMLLNTSNKSELAMGYSTLYGDQAGGLCPIGDLLKNQVYALSNYYNKEQELIPKFILEREPSAELRPDQKDSDTLPPYSELDRAVDNLVAQRLPAKNAVEKRVLQQLMVTEFKRWQAPPIIKISHHSFGRGRRVPVAHKAIY